MQNAKYKEQLNNENVQQREQRWSSFFMKVVDSGNFDQEFRIFRDKLNPDQIPEYEAEDREDYFQRIHSMGFPVPVAFWILDANAPDDRGRWTWRADI